MIYDLFLSVAISVEKASCSERMLPTLLLYLSCVVDVGSAVLP